jgi:hypothetical protein
MVPYLLTYYLGNFDTNYILFSQMLKISQKNIFHIYIDLNISWRKYWIFKNILFFKMKKFKVNSLNYD